MYLLFYFIPLFVTFLKKRSIATLVTGIIIISLIGTVFIGREIVMEDIGDILSIAATIIFLSFIILPWKTYRRVNRIEPVNESSLTHITWVLFAINAFIFAVLLTVTIIVITNVEDVNEFKYAEGVSMDFYYTFLPFNVTFFNIALLFYYLAYFVLPLHFYYLYKKRYKLAFFCFLLSLNTVLYGLTFFSRAVIVQYVFLYLALYYLLRKSFNYKLRKAVQVISILILIVTTVYFISISTKRFSEHESYSQTIPVNAVIQDPTLYSYADYLSQWYFNGDELLKRYDFQTFSTQISFQPILAMLSQLGIINYNTNQYVKYRQQLWPGHYWYSFNGYVAYTIYDYGIIGALLFSILYIFIVHKNRPQNGGMKMNTLFTTALTIQIPLMAIFYSQVSVIIIAFLFLLIINTYLKWR